MGIKNDLEKKKKTYVKKHLEKYNTYINTNKIHSNMNFSLQNAINTINILY